MPLQLELDDLLPAAGPVAGVDEAGRGPWAGPVVAAAVILDPAAPIDGLNDSKKLSAKRREALFAEIMARAAVGVGAASAGEIDRLNVVQATFLAMRRAVAKLPVSPQGLLIDGNLTPPGLPCPARAIVKGDARIAAIGAASIIAKVIRDRAMVALDRRYPAFAWASNKGYGAAAHREGLLAQGPTRHHRFSYRPVADAAHKMLGADGIAAPYRESA